MLEKHVRRVGTSEMFFKLAIINLDLKKKMLIVGKPGCSLEKLSSYSFAIHSKRRKGKTGEMGGGGDKSEIIWMVVQTGPMRQSHKKSAFPSQGYKIIFQPAC